MLSFYLALIETEEDQRLFERIYKTYQQKMYKYAFKLLRDEGYAEDIVHDVFLSIVRNGVDKIRHVEQEERLWVYLAYAVRYRCISFYDKIGKHISTEEEYSDAISKDENEDNTAQESTYQYVTEAIRALPPTYADVLYYSLIQEMTAPQIAKLLDLTPAAVRQRIVRGKKILREKLGEDFNV